MRRAASTDAIEAAALAAAAADGVKPPVGGSVTGGGGGQANGSGSGSGSGAGGVSSVPASGESARKDPSSGASGANGDSSSSGKDGKASSSSSSSGKKQKPNGLRRGKWTAEEEAYANRLIQEFKSGLLPLTDGTTLRTFLSKLLNCDPMRISKKFVGQKCIGKQVFRRRQADMDKLSPDEIERSRRDLAELERRFLERVAQSSRVKGGGGKTSSSASKHDSNGLLKAADAAAMAHVKGGAGSSLELSQNMMGASPPMIAPWMMPPQAVNAFTQQKMMNGASMSMGMMYPFSGTQAARTSGASGGVAQHQPAMQNAQTPGAGLQGGGAIGPLSYLSGAGAMPNSAQRQQQQAQQAQQRQRQQQQQRHHQAIGGQGGGMNGVSVAGGLNLSGGRGAQLQSGSFREASGVLHSNGMAESLHGDVGSRPPQGASGASMGPPPFSGGGHASASSGMDRSNSMDALASLDLPSVQSMENLAALGLMFSSNNNLHGMNSEGASRSLPRNASKGDTAKTTVTRRNNSVEDFLSLVASGDIPAVDNDFLSLPIFTQLQQPGNTAGAPGGAARGPMAPPSGTYGQSDDQGEEVLNVMKQSANLATLMSSESKRPNKRLKRES